TGAVQGIEHSIVVLELSRGHDPLGAGPSTAAGVHGIPLDLTDVERFLVDVGEDPARRLAVEADARDDPVLPPILLRPAGGFEVGVIVPLRGIGVTAKFRHGSWASHCNALTRPTAGDTRDTKNTRNTKREHKQNVLCSFLCGRRVLSVLRAHGSRRRVQRDSDDRYDKGTDCPASTQMYSQAAPPASARSA